MTNRSLAIQLLGALALAAQAESAAATEVFKWIDAAGTVHYSDTKPMNVDAVETLRLEKTTASNYDPADDPYSILNQAERIGHAWTETQLESRARATEPPIEPYENWGYEDWGYVDYGEVPYPAYAAPVYLPLRPPLRTAQHAPNAARRQAAAMQDLALTAPRPHSINSGTHRARVDQSRDLPLVTPRPRR